MSNPASRCRWIVTAILAGISCLGVCAQNPQLNTKTGSRFPTVIFSSVLWSADPSYYSIAIDSTGTATYQSAPNSVEHTGSPYTLEFQVTDRTRRITFNLARELNFFGDGVPVSTGSPETTVVRTLAYHDLQADHQITYTTSTNSDIEELTSVLEEISQTLEFGRRLAYFRRHEPKALDSELDRLQANADRHMLREFQAIAVVLRGIIADDNLPGTARQKASVLLKALAQPSSTP